MTATVRGIATSGREGGIDKELQSEYRVIYYVTTSDISDGPAEVRQAFGIPAIGDIYQAGNDFDSRAIVIEKTARQRESPWEWEVEVAYSTDFGDSPEEDPNPLSQPPEISFGFEIRQRVVPGFFNDPINPNGLQNLELGIVNSAGELFDPAPEMEVADPVLTVKKNLSYVTIDEFMAVANTVNFSYFYGAMPRQLRLKPPQTQRAFDKMVGFYWPTTFEFVYRWETWDLQVLNAGTYYLSGSTRKKFEMSDGTPFIGLLNSTGGAINSSSADTLGRFVAGGDAPTFQRLRIFREIDFNALGII